MSGGVGFELRGIRRSYEKGLVRALAGLDLTIAPGERVAIVGSTGAGKSTLLAILGLIERPEEGTMRIDGIDPQHLRPWEDWRAANAGLVFQLHHLLPHLTALENVALPLWHRLGRREALRRAGETLEAIGLAHRAGAKAATLSGGERQMAAVARALVAEPRFLLADEPTGSVDSATGARIMELLTAWNVRSGATLVVATHDAAIAASCERVIRLRDGLVESDRREGHGPSRVAQPVPAAAS